MIKVTGKVGTVFGYYRLEIHMCILFCAATELQNWFLFYSVPILDGILPRPYFIQYCKLIQGVSILLGSHITPGLLNVAESSLKDF